MGVTEDGDAEDPTWTLCLTCSGGSKPPQRLVVSLPARSTSVAQLLQQARAAWGTTIAEEDQEEWHVSGVPRRLLTRDEWGFSLLEAGIRHQDRITLTISKASITVDPKKTAKNETTTTETAATITTSRTKRKAAVAATESFAAANTAMVEEDAPPRKRATRKAPSSAQHFRSLTTASPGRRLVDGAVLPETTRRRHRVKSTTDIATSQTSLEEGLVAATSDHSSAARLMRRGWRQAVQSAYEQNQAAARVAAAQNLSSSVFALLKGGEDDAASQSQQQQLQVNYPKGIQGRGTYTDVVDYLPHDLVVAAVQSLHPSEALRSSHLALLSPRVFWSLLYHFHSHRRAEELSTGHRDVVHAALQWSGPNCDWSYLRRRPEQLSAKALENRRQQQQVDGNWEAAAAAIADVESAMEHMWANTKATNATSPDTFDTEEDDWKIVTPPDEDLDELRECLTAAECDDDISPDQVDAIVSALSQHFAIHNWRELANASVEDLSTSLRAALPDTPVSNVAGWIEQAQSRSLEEIMIELCDGDVAAFEGLREGARSGTPADLVVWESIPGTLLQQLRPSVVDYDGYSEEALRRWCRRARRALEQLEWLADYTTPIEDARVE